MLARALHGGGLGGGFGEIMLTFSPVFGKDIDGIEHHCKKVQK
jgi:hypothetical protein